MIIFLIIQLSVYIYILEKIKLTFFIYILLFSYDIKMKL